MLKLSRCNDDAIRNDPGRMRVTDLTLPNLTSSKPMSDCMNLIENYWTEIYEIWYECCVTGHYSKLILSNFFHFLIPSRLMLKLPRWDDGDPISHDPLRMRLARLTQTKTTYPNLLTHLSL
jgi:hypothetical protein